MREINETSIGLADGTGFIAEMAVFHELHCIVSIFNVNDNCCGINL